MLFETRQGGSSTYARLVRLVVAGVVVLGVSILFSRSGLCDPAALTRFVEGLPKQPRGVSFAAGTPSAVGIREKLAISVELREEGYPAAVYIAADGGVTFLASPRRAAARAAGLWDLFDLDTQKTTGPEGYDFLVVLLHPSTPWTESAEVEIRELRPGAAEIPALLERIASQLGEGTASAATQVLEIGPGEGTRALQKKKRPSVPVWLAGVRG